MPTNRPEGSLPLEQALARLAEFEGMAKVALSGAVARDPDAFLDMARKLFGRVYDGGWSFDDDDVWRKADGPGTHRDVDQMALRFREVVLENRDKAVAKAMEEKAHSLVPEKDRLAMLVEVLYARGGGLDPKGTVIPPGPAQR